MHPYFQAQIRAAAAVVGALAVASCGGDVEASFDANAPGAGTGAARHLIVIVVDTLRADAVGYVNGEYGRTPVLDELADSGTAFTAVESPSSWTVPATVSLLSGLTPLEHGAANRMFEEIPGDVPLLAPLLKEEGFHTAGIIANPLLSERIAFHRGYDVFQRLERSPAREMVDAALAWAEEAAGRDERLHLYLHLYDPHWPYDPAPPEAERYAIGPSPLSEGHQIQLVGRMRNGDDVATARLVEWSEWAHGAYGACVASADRELGRLLEGLERLGIAEDALIVFTSDHGEEFGEHDCIGHNRQLHAESLHVPLIIAGPGVPRGVRHTEPLPLRAVPATVLPLLGLEAPAASAGLDLLDEDARTWMAREPQVSFLNVGLWQQSPMTFETVEFLLGLRRADQRFFWSFNGEFSSGQGRLVGVSGAEATLDLFSGMKRNLQEKWRTARWAANLEGAEAANQREAEMRALGYIGGEPDDASDDAPDDAPDDVR